MFHPLLLALILPAVDCAAIVPSPQEIEEKIRWQPRLIVEFHVCDFNRRRYVVATAANASWDGLAIRRPDLYTSSAPRITFKEIEALVNARPLLPRRRGSVVRLGAAEAVLIFGPELPPNSPLPRSVAIDIATMDWGVTVLRDEDGQRERIRVH